MGATSEYLAADMPFLNLLLLWSAVGSRLALNLRAKWVKWLLVQSRSAEVFEQWSLSELNHCNRSPALPKLMNNEV